MKKISVDGKVFHAHGWTVFIKYKRSSYQKQCTYSIKYPSKFQYKSSQILKEKF